MTKPNTEGSPDFIISKFEIPLFRKFPFCSSGYLRMRKSNANEEIRKHTRMEKITPNDFHDETKYRRIPGYRDFKIRLTLFPRIIVAPINISKK